MVPKFSTQSRAKGPSIGRPSVFVRASRCNLHCVWCDTDYTWNWIGTPYAHARDGDPGYEKFDKKRETITLAADETARRISEFDCRNIVLTGGEPMLQQAAWVEVMTRLRDIESDYRFEVETNGTLIPDVRFDALACQYNVSPKLSNSAVSRSLREKEEALRALVANPKAIFKYVIATPEDLTEVLEQTAGLQTARDRVFLMPEGARRRNAGTTYAVAVGGLPSHGISILGSSARSCVRR